MVEGPGAAATSGRNGASASRTPLLAFEDVTKAFGSRRALKGVDLAVHTGRIHALLGANGSGKSTLIKIAYGDHLPTSGRLLVNGRSVLLASPKDAHAAGIASVPQELPLVPGLSVADNVFMGHMPRRRSSWLDRAELHRRSRQLLNTLDVDVDPRVRVADLDLPDRQLIAIARALARRARVIVLDEPTSALSESSSRHLRHALVRLSRQGTGILLVTQRLNDVFECADELTVLHEGERVGHGPTAEFTSESLLDLMAGTPSRAPATPRRAALRGRALQGDSGPLLQVDLPGTVRAAGFSFSVAPGEVVAVAGPGAAPLVRGLATGLPAGGRATLAGRRVDHLSAHRRAALGLAYVSGDRQRNGVIPDLSVEANILLSVHACRGSARLRRRRDSLIAAGQQVAFGIQPPDLSVPMRSLSGGNQQKVVVARWAVTQPVLWLLDDCTRGVDPLAQSQIHASLLQAVSDGASVVVSSSDHSELLALSTRLLVLGPAGATEVDPGVLTTAQLELLVAAASLGSPGIAALPPTPMEALS